MSQGRADPCRLTRDGAGPYHLTRGRAPLYSPALNRSAAYALNRSAACALNRSAVRVHAHVHAKALSLGLAPPAALAPHPAALCRCRAGVDEAAAAAACKAPPAPRQPPVSGCTLALTLRRGRCGARVGGDRSWVSRQ
ncbi:hypothetical protein GCM10023086_36150 [Streptomyces venetus]|uniref:Uncharacterized protein n=1 Tax=Streptomyces venetus TaxID=1701086 RepID=A0ABP8G0D1_9ACTN